MHTLIVKSTPITNREVKQTKPNHIDNNCMLERSICQALAKNLANQATSRLLLSAFLDGAK